MSDTHNIAIASNMYTEVTKHCISSASERSERADLLGSQNQNAPGVRTYVNFDLCDLYHRACA